MIEAYRVRKRFQWRGWEFAPSGECGCGCPGCSGQVGSGCQACPQGVCRCACNIPPETYGGDIWLVEAGHPRKEILLLQRFAISDVSIPLVDELMSKAEFARLLAPPGSEVKVQRETRELVVVGRGRPRKG